MRPGPICDRISFVAFLAVALSWPSRGIADHALTFACEPANDLYVAVDKGGSHPARFATAEEAVAQAQPGSGVLLLADGYPAKRNDVPDAVLQSARAKHLRVYIEYPRSLPGISVRGPQTTGWERAVVASDAFAGAGLAKLRILSPQGCRFLITDTQSPGLVMARVAGFDRALFGLPKSTVPLLFRTSEGDRIATTRLSQFVTGRFAPLADWTAVWERILAQLADADHGSKLVIEPSVRPAYMPGAPLPAACDAEAVVHYAQWVEHSGLLIPPSRRDALYKLMQSGAETTGPPAPKDPVGDGSLGIMEGYASQIQPDGSQLRRTPIRADCQAETAMVLALHASLAPAPHSREIARHLLDFVYHTSDLHGGVRGNPHHPAFGLIAWGTVTPAWEVANYGDDNARTLLATLAAAASLDSTAWDEPALEALLANLRTTGKLGFRGDRIDIPDLEKNGWRGYHDASPVNYAPHFESYLWACDLWAYRHTGEGEFRDRAETAIAMTMRAYPNQWRWGDNLERARMLLPLAWLIRVEDTPEHRQWLARVSSDLLKDQQPCGAIRERLREGRGGFFAAPASNEAYGTGETPLIQQDGDPVSDQLYTTGFALLGLHEAAVATGDAKLRDAEDRLADYLVRIQTRSDRIPYLAGTWFRAFDYQRWECWASSADIGWGAWSIEAGWGQAWTAATLGMRAKHTSLWDLTAGSKIRDGLPRVRELMAQNDGRPWKK